MISLFGKGSKKKSSKKKPKKATKKKTVKKKPVKKKAVKKVKKKAVKKTAKKIVKKSTKKKASKKTTKKTVNKTTRKKAVKKKEEPLRMDEKKAYDKLKTGKIPTAPYMFIKKEKDIKAAMKKAGVPCVMKVAGTSIMHKTEKNGIYMNIDSEERALEAFNKLMKIKGADQVVVQKQLEGLELIVGTKKSDEFGYVVSAGIGGIYVEILKDVTFRIAPLSKNDAEEMIKELKGYEILKGIRGKKAINMEKLHDLLVKISKFAINNKYKEMDINPLICNEDGCWATDIRIIE